MTEPATCVVDSLEISKVGPLTEKCELGMSMADCNQANDVENSNNEKSNTDDIEEDQVTESDDGKLEVVVRGNQILILTGGSSKSKKKESEEDQVAEQDAVNGKVNEHPDRKCVEDYPPLPISRSRKVESNIVAVTSSRKEVSNIAPGTKDVEAVAVEPFCFLMKVPRLDDASVQEQISLAKIQVDEKTRLRDSIQLQIEEKRANSQSHRLDYESAKDEVNKAKLLVKSKLKKLREESPADLGSEDELHLKILRKELQILKESIVTAAAAATEADKLYNAEDLKIKQLHAKCRAANDARRAANVHLQSLKEKLHAKNQQFFQYKDDAAAANNYARSGNKKALHRLCANQVERIMELWNTNDEFRRDYVNSNTRSAIRRLGTLDGRSLGPGEKPTALPIYPRERVDLVPKIPTNVTRADKLLNRRKEDENGKVTNKKPTTRPALKKLSETELTKKAEEMLRREEAEAKLKEQRLLEELAKAEVAREKKKKRQAVKEQKEAEEKEKERQRRLRKKEKKVADAAMDVNNDISNSESSRLWYLRRLESVGHRQRHCLCLQLFCWAIGTRKVIGS
ncbi:hypothetical protein PHJA_002170900 [Phtheirospermum japonicum]|uniref:Uncharacterized protein n=1 Tax=Phtheirospermum japonicum TaxID=374723 RepID=A0A830CRP2_9LAMI|nr:hypothetical protein PHJA_002170900 [Phtheirospermum japonicum]